MIKQTINQMILKTKIAKNNQNPMTLLKLTKINNNNKNIMI